MKKVISVVLVFLMTMVIGMSTVFAATSYDSVAQFDKTKANGAVWQYMYSTDQGKTFQVIDKAFNDWGNGGGSWNPNITDCWAGIGFNPDVKDTIEFNSTDANAQLGALAFIAPKDGEYKIAAFSVKAPWSQTPDQFYVYNGSTKVYSGAVPADGSALNVPEAKVTMKAGDKLYFYATNSSKFTSVYTKIVVEEVAAATAPATTTTPAADTNPKTGDNTPVILLAALMILSGAGIVLSRKLRHQ